MNTKQKIAVALGLAGAATAYAAGGEIRAVQPTSGEIYGVGSAFYSLPGEVNGFTKGFVKQDSTFGGFSNLSRKIVGPLAAQVTIGHDKQPISRLEAGAIASIEDTVNHRLAQVYATNSLNSIKGTVGALGSVTQEIAKIRKIPVKARLDAVAEMSYEGLKPTFFFGQVEPSIEIGPVRLGYDFTGTSDGITHEVFVGLGFN